MKKIAFLILMYLLNVSVSCLNAKGINKMYVQRNAGNECVFFVFSQKLPGCETTRKEIKRVDYDYTYAQRTDSVSMLMTLDVHGSLRNAIGTIAIDTPVCSSPLELIYVKAKGNKMQYRMRLMMSFQEFEKMYSSLNPFVLTISSDNGLHEFCFSYNPNKWEYNRIKMCEIIELIKLNTGK